MTIQKHYPGSEGEHELQKWFGHERRAYAFYNKQMLPELAPLMMEYVQKQQMFFMATADKQGNCDCTYRAGKPGFVTVINNKSLCYPEYRGNGVMASLGNIRENPHIGVIFIDFFETKVGLHINGKARIVFKDDLAHALHHDQDVIDRVKQNDIADKLIECYVMIEVEEAYIHCSKHIPQLQILNKEFNWGTDDKKLKGGDAFKVKAYPRPWKTD